MSSKLKASKALVSSPTFEAELNAAENHRRRLNPVALHSYYSLKTIR
ncbi:MAG: hypothetical protein AB8B50_19745 [Pirellulaceae bacterium]